MNSDLTKSLIEAIPMATILVGSDERVQAANTEAGKLLGQGITGRHFITVLRQPTVLDAIESCLRGVSSANSRYLTSDGGQDSTYKVSVRHIPELGAMICFEDVTHLEQAGQMRRDFVANVSHELRTPLTALMGFIETLRGPAKDDATARERFLAIMEREAGRMNRLVGDLLSLSRVESEERVRPKTRVDLCGLVRSTAHWLAPLAKDAEVTLTLDLPADPLEIAGDQDQLRQVLINLTENAIKYSGKGSEVTLSVTAPAYHARLRSAGTELTIRDTGAGIDPVHIPRLTERFYRVDSHRSREMGGTGLGLAIVKHIVNRHRGRLRISSTKGQGTAVSVLLPAD
ncbi:two-component system phosphate regulon sensor histidine kinase PhoR [Primorskyibacter sedentarius]|uniref:histidine kinase n=1 Tax=Primorskyibacter sedentarius TaxID=745311 RepID=A0A4R3J860_9RHOB|nr:ATP-binding protein [Primorskyibacter sedentarius]TCS61113.1 two-component system phosphate regulon sensor histidine kinase PhoR [Primorskyibacter sedentarius]